ncbi:MAG: bifunctional UDP-N-acetylmuramoyl-tripeptide:D-alanyl-D-alanine ligase/alanine racemase [Flammeovirgaceae bacterium]
MMFSQLLSITHGTLLQWVEDKVVQNLLTDSRKSVVASGSVFFAIAGQRHDGHIYVNELYKQGVRQFVVERPVDLQLMPLANVVQVKSCIDAIQLLAIHHRQAFSIPVIGITGSNAKTIIKEWLYQMLSLDGSVVKNPGSYNSQLGVPLSVWQMRPHHQLGIFEAGISKGSEMVKLETIIQPTVGLFTNIGTAHNEGFASLEAKIAEKLTLFKHVKVLIYCIDHTPIHQQVQAQKLPALTWGTNDQADVYVRATGKNYEVQYRDNNFDLVLPFQDAASIENALHCMVLLLYWGYRPSEIQNRIKHLKSVAMRLELKQGINHCQLVDDTYNNDLAGLRISLDFLSSQQKKKKTLILSDILQSGLSDAELITKIAELVKASNVNQFVGIGEKLKAHSRCFHPKSIFFDSTESFLASRVWENFSGELILVKGARAFHFEKIIAVLERKIHGTVMEIDLNKMVHNLNFFKSKLKPGVKLMVMVKAFAYGSGSEEVANLLQYHQVDYLGVAYADEGMELRKNNIGLPIMVMNPAEESFPHLLLHGLEPVMYNLKILHSFLEFVGNRGATIHIEIDTGMHRLGFEAEDADEIISLLKSKPNVKVASVFSHLAGADEYVHDGFSQTQYKRYQQFYKLLSQKLGISPLRHILNSPGILRLPDFQMDMVRLGIGLYGVNPTEESFAQLQPVATLKTILSQIRTIKKGETVGYGRKGVAEKDLELATIAIGYADGFSRGFSQGRGVVLVRGNLAPVVGNVCMDMTMIDVTGLGAHEGDEIIIFGDGLPIHEVAQRLGTIPYEILTNTSERVKRIFFTEGI